MCKICLIKQEVDKKNAEISAKNKRNNLKYKSITLDSQVEYKDELNEINIFSYNHKDESCSYIDVYSLINIKNLIVLNYTFTDFSVFTKLRVINCSFTNTLIDFPKCPSLQSLICSYCVNLKTIDISDFAQDLICVGCTSLTKINYQYFDVSQYKNISCKSGNIIHESKTDILQEYEDIKGTFDTKFLGGNYQGFTDLNCADCTALKEIPFIESLKNLWYSGCPNITTLPKFTQLIKCIK